METELSNPEALKMFEQIDEFVINEACEHPEWFKKKKGQKMSKEVIRQFYRGCVQQSNKEYPALLRVKVVEGENELNDTIIREVYQGDDPDLKGTYTLGDAFTVKANTDIITILKIKGLWFVGGRFGLTITAQDILAWTPQSQEDAWNFSLPGGLMLSKRKRDDDDQKTPAAKKLHVDNTIFNGGLECKEEVDTINAP